VIVLDPTTMRIGQLADQLRELAEDALDLVLATVLIVYDERHGIDRLKAHLTGAADFLEDLRRLDAAFLAREQQRKRDL
jgi:hypothetical protein